MTKYVKIKENGEALEYAPRDIPGISNWGLDEANVLAAGFPPPGGKACALKRRSPATASATS